MSLSDKFCGVVARRKYAQVLAVETVPTLFLNGVPAAWRRYVVRGSTTEEEFRFVGLTVQESKTTGSVTVRDINNDQYTVSFDQSVTVSGGSQPVETGSNTVVISRVSPRMWEATVVKKTTVIET